MVTTTTSMATTTPDVGYSVLLPTYEERENLPLIVWLLVRALAALPGSPTYEILIIDDNSPDGTFEIAKDLATRVFAVESNKQGFPIIRPLWRPGKLGLGSAYVFGLREAKGEFVIILDADMSHHPDDIAAMVQRQAADNCDIVTGSRYCYSTGPRGGVCGWDLKRKLTSRVANYIATVLLRPGDLTDLTGSFRLYRRSALESIIHKVQSKGYTFQMEIMIRAIDAGMSFGEVPITFVDRLYGESKLGGAEVINYLKGLFFLFWTT